MKHSFLKKTAVAFGVASIIASSILISCNKEPLSSPQNTNEATELKSANETDLVDQIAGDFEKSIKEAIEDRDYLEKSGEPAVPIDEMIAAKFEAKTLEYTNDEKIGNLMKLEQMQYYMTILSDLLLDVEELYNEKIIIEKESLFLKFDYRFKTFTKKIMADKSLTETQKQQVVTNGLLRLKIIKITLTYSEDIADVRLKGLRDWFSRNRKTIMCSIGTATTVSHCINPTAALIFCARRIATTTHCWLSR